MKKTAFSFAAALLATTAATPALADVEVWIDIDKTKDIQVTETIDIEKEAVIGVRMGTPDDPNTPHVDERIPFQLSAAAEASAYVNVTNTDNLHNISVEENADVFDVRRTALMRRSVGVDGNGNTGITGVNQDAGDMTNQANVVAVALILRSADEFANSQAGTDQRNTDNTVVARESVDGILNFNDHFDADPDQVVDDNEWQTQSLMFGSVNDNTGLVGVNQNSGNMNNQTNSLSLALGENSVLALAEGQLGQVNADNKVDAFETLRRDRIHASVNDNTGAVQVNQSAGNMNNQASSMSFAASIDAVGTVAVSGGFTQAP